MNSDVLKENLGLIQQAKVAATSGLEMRGIADAVAAGYIENQRLPLRNFPQFLRDNVQEKGGGSSRDVTKDMWEMPFRIVADVQKNGFEIWSAGPDKFWTNEDDLRYFYDLTGLGGKKAIDQSQYVEWNALVLAYKRANDAQAASKKSGQSVAGGSDANSKSAGSSKSGGSKVSDRDRKRLESLLTRAESGSASAQEQLADKFMKGDTGVEKNLAKAKEYLEAALESTESSLKRKQLETKLAEVKANLEIEGIPTQ